MSEEGERGTKIQLALAVAAGIAVKKWARQHQVPARTAYRWSKDPDLRKDVERARRKWIDQAVGKMTRRLASTVDKLGKLADQTTSDSVKLRALRGEYTDMMAISRYSDLEVRMTGIEEKLEARRTRQLEGARGEGWESIPTVRGPLELPSPG
jgi:hypothetical protein